MLVHLDRRLLCVVIITGGWHGHKQNYHQTGEYKRKEANRNQRPRAEVLLGMQNTAGAKTLIFLHFLSVLVLFFLLSPDLPCFHPLRCFSHAESRENRHLQNFSPSSFAPLCWKIEKKKETSKWLCTIITQFLHSPLEGLPVWGVFTEAGMMSKWEY